MSPAAHAMATVVRIARNLDRRRLRVAVGIATAGRPATLAQVVAELGAQSLRPEAVVVCAPCAADTAGLSGHPALHILTGPHGLTRQRNAILDHLDGFDVVFFFDDDFVPHPRYIEECERLFAGRPDVVMTTGRVASDGILGPGLTFTEAHAAIARADPLAGSRPPETVYNAYGCNMGVRLAPVRANQIRFDETLPLYGWLEDVDFSRAVARHGTILKVPTAVGVHLGIKSGRQSGVRLGYSQIANPLYLVGKGTCSWRKAAHLMSRNVAANVVKSVRPEPWVDRIGRVRGNGRALIDLVAGRISPMRVLGL
ncbi:glycosyltransferase family 2 protein [Rhodoplanes sp. TEM]|uniref:Glycosyltransferase family 2 protein n=1 Tax=Rhodoplanes tepidamans TaxID=200616 RepID=A0ABT5J7G9_RHOTP|nr:MULTISPECIES: glycosyltransferase family 2 protein [Rhodoplanes]MDC7785239.1 glycosyltransferase family 2 protein [Rhodoplanes tepidamans]MDC7986409.1 glycosyltransferase family 2 protein [Rhodoplanes sp. TEM]MDQ0353497.1 GT2 family glycosyltransferase [Rhodoplanes tepidamans]